MKICKQYLFILCLLFSCFSFAQGNDVIHIHSISDSQSIELNKYWKFHNGDNLLWAAPDVDESNWENVESDLGFSGNGETKFKGICWLRIHIYIDQKDTALCFLIFQRGASEIFIDGKLIHSIGVVSSDEKKEVRYNPNLIPLSFPELDPGPHVIAVRYSNQEYISHYEKYENRDPGIQISIGKQDASVFSFIQTKITIISVALIVGIFLFTLGFVHLLLFLFYRKQRTNLYYSIFVFLFGSLFIFFTISNNVTDPDLSTLLDHYFIFIFVLFFYTLLLLHYSLFKRGSAKYRKFITVFLIITLISMTIKFNNFSMTLLLAFITSTVIPSFFIVIRSIRDKLDGAWIIGTGSLSFLILLAIVILKLMFFGSSLHVDGLFMTTLVFIAMISIPVSMSVYLAREFSLTNKHLEKKLFEVEQLSARSIEQEKEKQRILETQKDVLEIQVKERTSEIEEQKKVIEEKNKDITDSINYAKRIQEAILPAKELKYRIFSTTFVLFKPKDIVSGDFYWFAEKNGKKIIASCDCTGHGVPGALMSMVGNNILNQIVNEKGITSPDEILTMLNKEVVKALNQEGHAETKDGMDIALLTFNSATEIEYAGAQRPLWMIKNGVFEEIKGDKLSIGGIMDAEKKFTKHTISLSANDCLYIFSDGFVDQFGGKDGKKFMSKQFKETLLSNYTLPVAEQEKALDDIIESWKGKREQVDDILVIGIKI